MSGFGVVGGPWREECRLILNLINLSAWTSAYCSPVVGDLIFNMVSCQSSTFPIENVLSPLAGLIYLSSVCPRFMWWRPSLCHKIANTIFKWNQYSRYQSSPYSGAAMLSVSIFFFPASVSLPLFPPVGSPICLFSGCEAFMFVCGSLSLSPSLFLSDPVIHPATVHVCAGSPNHQSGRLRAPGPQQGPHGHTGSPRRLQHDLLRLLLQRQRRHPRQPGH